MATNLSHDAPPVRPDLEAAIHRHWVLFLTEGIILVLLGMLAMLAPPLASLAATVLFGWILLVSGIVGLVTTVRTRHAPGFGWSLASALLGLAAGIVLLGWPVQGVFSLTTVLIAFLLIEGIVSILYALDHRKGLSSRWGWMLASGAVDLLLGGVLFAGLPGTAVWALGVLVGVNLIFGGWALIAMALGARTGAARPG